MNILLTELEFRKAHIESRSQSSFMTFLCSHLFSPHNVPSFRACCSLLASLSGYQYTRRAWKKEVMELLLDPNFFQMDITCIGSWRMIIDNLMTQDNTSFKELMARVAGLSQSASINIFANREQVISSFHLFVDTDA